jgi:L-asparagine oxygenase
VATKIVDAKKIVSEIGENVLSRTLAIPRRPAFNNNYLLRLLSKSTGRPDIFRWDELFIKPVNQASSEVFNTISHLHGFLNPKNLFLENSGDILVIDNWRMLHGRSAVPRNYLSRNIERVYLRSIN